MASFVEVMRQAERLCSSASSCDDCTLCKGGSCEICLYLYIQDVDYALLEQKVMQWAAEHPGPRYPTWKEWWKENFPDAESCFVPCNFMSGKEWYSITKIICRGKAPCKECQNKPIPAHIAEKLGIKPIGGEKDG